MLRLARLLETIGKRRDWPTAVFLVAMSLIALWLAGMTFWPAIQRCTLHRFHLQTRPFAFWSLQQIVPSMYNLENEFEFEADGAVPETVAGFTKTRHLNHFPLRVITFFDYRYGLFHAGNGARLRIISRYRAQRLTTDWRVRREGKLLILEQTGATP